MRTNIPIADRNIFDVLESQLVKGWGMEKYSFRQPMPKTLTIQWVCWLNEDPRMIESWREMRISARPSITTNHHVAVAAIVFCKPLGFALVFVTFQLIQMHNLIVCALSAHLFIQAARGSKWRHEMCREASKRHHFASLSREREREYSPWLTRDTYT